MPNIVLSLVVPMFNEAQGLGELFSRCEAVLRELGGDYEIVCVNDGSRDDTLARLLEHRSRNPLIKVVNLSRNFGQDAAFSAGFSLCRGQAVIPMDADLQHPPELIPDMVEKWREGWDIVYGVRTDREGESVVKRLTSWMFWRLYNWIADVPVPENTGIFRLMSRRAVDAVNNLPENQRFLRALLSYAGYPATQVSYLCPPRAAGATKWRYWQLWNLAMNGITAFSTFPLRMWSYIGGVIAASAFCYAAYLAVRKLAAGADVPGYASLIVTILFMGGMHLVTMGVLGEYIGRIFHEVKGRPAYIIESMHGFDDAD